MPANLPIVPDSRTGALPSRQMAPAPKRRAFALTHARPSIQHSSSLFWGIFAGLTAAVIWQARGQTLGGTVGALLIISAAMTPSYLWVIGKVRGLPLFPGYALTFIWGFGLPLVEDHPVVTLFPSWNQFVAGCSVTGFLVIGTLVWYPIARKTPRPPTFCWGMEDAQNTLFLLVALGICTLWTVASTAAWISLPGGLASIASAILIAVEALTCFVLSYQLGKRKLSSPAKFAFYLLLGTMLAAILPNLLLITAMSLIAVACIAYVFASKKLPWLGMSLAIGIFAFLHLGKAEMREKHWHEEESPGITPAGYPTFFSEWVQASFKALQRPADDEDRGESLLERSSLMHWLLYFQAVTPGQVPYLNGSTYAVIPRMFVPRILDPEKPMSSEAGDLIAVTYGIQTREGTETTHLAFGLLDEAFVNFGFTGMALLGVILGATYGKVAQWARMMPILSFRSLFAVLVASYCFEAEFTSTYYVAAIFQSTIVLIVVGVVFMRRIKRKSAHISLLE